jgi:flagellar biosynthesis GTPase FlhF
MNDNVSNEVIDKNFLIDDNSIQNEFVVGNQNLDKIENISEVSAEDALSNYLSKQSEEIEDSSSEVDSSKMVNRLVKALEKMPETIRESYVKRILGMEAKEIKALTRFIKAEAYQDMVLRMANCLSKNFAVAKLDGQDCVLEKSTSGFWDIRSSKLSLGYLAKYLMHEMSSVMPDWDEAYRYMVGTNPRIMENLADSALQIMAKNNKIVECSSKAVDEECDKFANYPEEPVIVLSDGYVKVYKNKLEYCKVGETGYKEIYSPVSLGITLEEFKSAMTSKEPENFNKTVKYMFNDNEEKIQIFTRFLSACLAPNINDKFQYFVNLVGASGIGKGVVSNAIIAVLGGQNSVCGVAADDFRGDGAKNNLAILRNALLNIAPESGSSQDLGEIVKKLTGNDLVTIKLLYVNAFSTRLTAKLLFVGNAPIKFKQSDLSAEDFSAIERRVVFLECEGKSVDSKNDDKYLLEKVLEEKPGILKVLVENLQALISENFKLKKPKNSGSEFIRIQRENSAITNFISDKISEKTGNFVSNATLMDAFVDYCKSQGLKKDRITTQSFNVKFAKEVPYAVKGISKDKTKRGFYNIDIDYFLKTPEVS